MSKSGVPSAPPLTACGEGRSEHEPEAQAGGAVQRVWLALLSAIPIADHLASERRRQGLHGLPHRGGRRALHPTEPETRATGGGTSGTAASPPADCSKALGAALPRIESSPSSLHNIWGHTVGNHRLPTLIVAAATAAILVGCSAAQDPQDQSGDTRPDQSSTPTDSVTTEVTKSGDVRPQAGTPSDRKDPGDRPPESEYDEVAGTGKKPKNQASVVNAMPGSAEGDCVIVGAEKDVRSGAWAMGDFKLARSDFKNKNPKLHFYLIPTARGTKKVTATFNLRGSTKSETVTATGPDTAGPWIYFPILVDLGSPGTWEIRVESAGGSSCWVTQLDR